MKNFKKACLSIYNFEKSEDVLNVSSTGSFLINDIYYCLKELYRTNEEFKENKIKILSIDNFDNDQEDKVEMIKEIIDVFGNSDYVICTTAYISTKEFPEDKYELRESNENDKLLIPVDEILERESKLLKDLDFEDVNDFIDYEFKIAFVYKNKIGKRLIEIIHENASNDIEERLVY